MSNANDPTPNIIITVKGGLVQGVASTGAPLTYQVVDFDGDAVDQVWESLVCETDADHINHQDYMQSVKDGRTDPFWERESR
jgi:hypothetical protein